MKSTRTAPFADPATHPRTSGRAATSALQPPHRHDAMRNRHDPAIIFSLATAAGPRTRRDYGFAAFLCTFSRIACSRAASSGGKMSEGKSDASNTWRISTSVPPSNGARLSHSTASSIDFTCHSQKPEISSLVSAKGPSITVRCCPENLTRLPFELGCSPSPASITPALTNSSLNFPIAAKTSLLGRTPASEFLSALTITMNRIVLSPCGFRFGTGLPHGLEPAEPSLHLHVERGLTKSTSALSFLRVFAKC